MKNRPIVGQIYFSRLSEGSGFLFLVQRIRGDRAYGVEVIDGRPTDRARSRSIDSLEEVGKKAVGRPSKYPPAMKMSSIQVPLHLKERLKELAIALAWGEVDQAIELMRKED